MTMNYTEYKYIDGEMFEIFLLGGAAWLKANIQKVNDLNVFPIPDGDTGDNMYLTISGGIREMQREDSPLLWRKAEALSRGMLLAARGNSGVILSQLFAGLCAALEEKERVTLQELTEAFNAGVERAYETVVTPVEGTILTVARESTQLLRFSDEDTTLGEYADYMLEVMHDSLANTPELLDVLKEAGVVDSGGAGLYMIAEGAAGVVRGEERAVQPSAEESSVAAEPAAAAPKMDLSLFTADSRLEFGYCTEFLLRLMHAKTDVEHFDEKVIIDYLSTIGDSIVCFKDDTIVKVHVHTMTPSKAMEFCQQFGEFLTLKIENMMLQHNNHVIQLAEKQETADPAAEGSQDELLLRHTEKRESSIPVVKKKRSKYATCVVTNGQGIIDIFREMGADEILVGGQGKNPSAQDFMDCFDRLNADAIFVFPNNANIVMAAEQAAGMYKDSRVFVIPSKSLGQAYTAMSMLDISFDTAEEVRDNFIANMEYAETGMVCKACREYESMEFTVSEDDYLGVSRNQLMSASADKVEALGVLCDKMGIEDRGIATVIYGESITDEDRDKTRRLFAEKWKDKEFYEIEGQQELYDLIVILE